MKRCINGVLLICSFFSYTAPIFADRNHPFIIEQGDRILDEDATPISTNSLKIMSKREGVSGEWYLYYLKKDGNFEKLNNIKNEGEYCVINPKENIWRDAYRYYDSKLKRNLFTMKVLFKEYSGQEESSLIDWALSPTKPEISDVSFKYEFDWNTNEIYPNGLFSFSVSSDDVTRFHTLVRESYNSDGTPSDHQWIISSDYEGPVTKISYEAAEWGEYLQIFAYNECTYISGDTTLCTTDYIDDPAVLERINELIKSDVKEISTDTSELFIQVNQKSVSFMRTADSVSIYDISGHLVSCYVKVDNIDISELTKGMYIVVCKYDNKLLRKKILKL